MNVYDFDDTILKGDSEIYFYKYCFNRFPEFARFKTLIAEVNQLKLEGYLEYEFSYNFVYPFMIKYVPNIDKVVNDFWDEHEQYIKDWYKKAHKEDDVIISGTPSFILKPIMERLHIKYLIASEIDLKTGKLAKPLNWKEEKVNRFKQLFKIEDIDNFYSDSIKDTAMAKVSKHAYKVTDDLIEDWIF